VALLDHVFKVDLDSSRFMLLLEVTDEKLQHFGLNLTVKTVQIQNRVKVEEDEDVAKDCFVITRREPAQYRVL